MYKLRVSTYQVYSKLYPYLNSTHAADNVLKKNFVIKNMKEVFRIRN